MAGIKNLRPLHHEFVYKAFILWLFRPSMNNTVYLSNLSYERDRSGIRKLLTPFGIVKNVTIIFDPKTSKSKGMAFVEMGSVEEAKKAIKGLNGTIVDGRTLKARFAKTVKETSEKKKTPKEKPELTFKDKQLAKKARNEARRKSNPLVFKKERKS